MSPASLAPNAQLMLAFGNLGNKQLTGIFTTIGCLAQTGLTCFLYILDTKVQCTMPEMNNDGLGQSASEHSWGCYIYTLHTEH